MKKLFLILVALMTLTAGMATAQMVEGQSAASYAAEKKALMMAKESVPGSTQTLGGVATDGALRIQILDNSRMAVARHRNGSWQEQWFSDDSKSIRLYAGGTAYAASGAYFSTSVTTLLTKSNTVLNSTDAELVLESAGKFRIKQKTYYPAGAAYLQLTWEITNISGGTVNDLRFFSGGDTYLSGGDNGAGFWEAGANTIGVRKGSPQQQNLLMQGNTIPYNHQSNRYNSVRDAVNANSLTGVVDPNEGTDNGMALEWRTATLAPGATWTISATEKFVDKTVTNLTISAPMAGQVAPGGSVDLTFAVQNRTGSSTSVNLASAIDLSGWTATVQSPASSFTLAGSASQNVIVRVSNPSGTALGTVAKVTLSATDGSGTATDFSNVEVAQVPTIDSHPSNANVGLGDPASFSISASNASTYQWQVFTTVWQNVSNAGVYSGATTTTLSISGAQSGMDGYQYRCVATNDYGAATSNTAILSVETSSPPTVTTQAVTSITPTTATGNGNITVLGVPNPTAHGVVWNTGGTPTTADSKTNGGAASSTGAFTASLSSLSPNTTYYIRAYATNTAGTSYGNQVSFTTSPMPATVTTQAVTSITPTTATGNGNITVLGVPNPTAHGVVWNTGGTPTTADSKTNGGAASATGAFTGSLAGLSPNTTYYVRAYATNTAGTVYGSQVSFTTLPVAATVTTQAVTSITPTTATGNGNITVLGVPNPTAHGVVWNTGGTPTTADSKTNGGAASATGAFTGNLAGLSPNTTYYVRAYATNTAGTVYGSQVSFTTLPVAATVTTQAVTSITPTTATGNGNITSLGVPNPTAHGVVWNTGGMPTTADSKTNGGAASATGAFTGSITGLSSNVTYYVRAYASNTAGTIYGSQVSFTSATAMPTAITNAASGIGETTATLNGTVNAKNANTTLSFEYGLTDSYGSTATSTPGSASGTSNTALSAALTGLTPNQTYHFRVKAVNDGGTTYGVDMTFTTSAAAPTAITDAASGIGETTATLNGTVNAKNANTTLSFEYGLTDSYGSTVTSTPGSASGTSNTALSAALTGLTPNQTYHFRVKAVNDGGTTYGVDMTFTTSAAAPTAITDAASGIGETTATLNGTVNAKNANTTLSFEYGLTDSYGSTATSTPGSASGTSNTSLSAALTGLTPNQIYHYRVKSVNDGGTTYGGDMTFTTTMAPPVAATSAATSVGQSSATLNGSMNARNTSTSITFEYGTDVSYGASINATPATVEGTETAVVNAALTVLAPNTLYHYRIVGTSGGGTTRGADMTFTTLMTVPVVTTTPATDVAQHSATLNGSLSELGAPAATAHGFVWGTAETPALTDQRVDLGTPSATGDFFAALTALDQGTIYYARSYAINAADTVYGEVVSFTTTHPELVLKSEGAVIANGDTLAFGDCPQHRYIDKTLTFYNTGNMALSLTVPVAITGEGAAPYTFLTQSASEIAAGDSSVFVLRFFPRSLGEKPATCTVVNSDADDTPMVWHLSGTGNPNRPDVFNVDQDTLQYAEGDGAVVVSSQTSTYDLDETPLHKARVRICQGYRPAEDLLAGSSPALAVNYDAISGALTFTGEADFETYNAALRSVTYNNLNTVNPDSVIRVLEYTVWDERTYGDHAYRTIRVEGVNDVPVLSAMESDTLIFGDDDESLQLTATVTVLDEDSAELDSATVRFSSGYVRGEDVLAYTGSVLSASFNSEKGVLALKGAASVASYQAALRQVVYRNRVENDISLHVRRIAVTVNDGTAESNTVSRALRMAKAEEISGPYLRYCFPPDSGRAVPKNTLIQFRVMEDRAGVDFSSLAVRVNGNSIVSGGVDLTSGNVSFLNHEPDTPHYTMIFENDTLYHPGDTVYVNVQCQDLKTPPQPLFRNYCFFIGQDEAEYSIPEPIGPEGGEFIDEVTDVQMAIPQEALRDTFDICIATVTETPALPDTVEGLKLSWHFSPAGLQFTDSIDVSIPYTQEMLDSAGVTDPMDLELYYFSTSEGEWQLLTIVDEEEGRVHVRVNEFCYLSVRMDPSCTAVADQSGQIPMNFAMHPAYPNPFNPETHVAFDLPRAGQVNLEVYDVRGRRVRQLIDEDLAAGRYAETWDGLDEQGITVASGLYFIRFVCDDYVKTRKVILLK